MGLLKGPEASEANRELVTVIETVSADGYVLGRIAWDGSTVT